MADSVPPFHAGEAEVRILPSNALAGAAAADKAAAILGEAIARDGHARMLVATGNSQIALIGALTRDRSVDWKRITVLHLDEYVGIRADHPASFRRWIREHLTSRVSVRDIHWIAGDCAELDAEVERYAQLIGSGSVALALVGFGENGHIAFNEPHSADFEEPSLVKRVILDEASRRQQVGEGHFARLNDVPHEAITVTCRALLNAEAWVCCVPEARKARAVQTALEGPVTAGCPASAVQIHRRTFVYLDQPSAALLSRRPERER